MTRFDRRVLTGALAVLCSVALVGAPAVASAAAASAGSAASAAPTAGSSAPAAPVASGADWTVEPLADGSGYRVTKTVSDLPDRSAVPVLWADGVALGAAVRTADGTGLVVDTSDEHVLQATSVLVGWSGEGDPADDAAARDGDDSADGARASVTPPTSGSTTAAGAAQLDVDPGAPGPYVVERADYDLGDEAEEIYGFDGARGEMRAAVYLPQGLAGELPVAVFLHGQHIACATDDPDAPAVWPCAAGETEIPSYLGYDGPAEALASNGYAVVSISANAINRLNGLHGADQGTDARGHLVLDHLALLRAADAGPVDGIGSSLVGRLDLDRVGLMGHSRGGDGVVRAAVLNASTLVGTPEGAFGIASVLALAPTNFTRTALPDVPTAVLLPYCDGDLVDLQGQHYVNDSRHAFGDDVLRSTVLVLGANHNAFNTVWSSPEYLESGDDWDENPTLGPDDPTCGSPAPSRLTRDEQYAVGTAYVAGFFRLTLGDETSLLGQFDGSDARPASIGRADVRVTAVYPSSARLDVNTFADPAVSVATSGRGVASYCESTENIADPSSLPFCLSGNVHPEQAGEFAGSLYGARIPATTSLHFQYSTEPAGRAEPSTLVVDVPGGSLDASGAEFLTVRAMPDETVVDSTELTVTVVDAAGGSATVNAADFGAALTRLPGSSSALPKMLYQDLRIPVSALDSVDLTRVASVVFTGVGTGAVLLSDLAFVTAPSIGSAAVVQRAVVSVQHGAVDVDASVSSAKVALVLAQPASEPVRGWLTHYASDQDLHALPFTVETGSRCVAVDVPLGTRRPDTGRRSGFGTSVGLVTGGGVVGAAFDSMLLRDTAVPVVDGDPTTLPYGLQGDACAEALAAESPVPLTAPATAAQGSVVQLSASGYRPGEGVTARLGDTPVAATLADATGTATLPATIPTTSPLGPTTLTFTGSGSALRATSPLTITPAPSPTPTPTPPAPSPDPSPAPTPDPGTGSGSVSSPDGTRLAATGVTPDSLTLPLMGSLAALVVGSALLLGLRTRVRARSRH
ncbi:hypothetical protein SCB71_12990 [Herbiconiux sp. KACC 21604]|uniref:hypothetical protein n=1 Tax=unclassified Herbiconiux TaxID=2618217 RepID=UPI0014914626|nr:hypothetical protein [Herbiconiux sp. SALV-R1]QJU54083.1 hypothetical protein HL652_10940 [Herbiconiux sp. SALV-R1]WPO85128.1 hypothetical protein SCB71_12990 [Herbiconiux sp. KACC 21604]